MNQDSKIDPREKRPSRKPPAHRGARAALRLAILFAAAAFVSGSARAETRGHAGTADTARGAAASKSNRDAGGRMSKFEARRIRHACYGRANESALKGAEREAFLSKCYFGRASHRGLRRECQQQGAARGLDKAALHEFVRECVRERAHPKE